MKTLHVMCTPGFYQSVPSKEALRDIHITVTALQNKVTPPVWVLRDTLSAYNRAAKRTVKKSVKSWRK